mmetsp:Transcript_12494/g.29515  ORF Transcript_12494/g.29515 Transcript_12494/m.29515 type:complete len:228 (+) Transcript_12494:638-1321(+)
MCVCTKRRAGTWSSRPGCWACRTCSGDCARAWRRPRETSATRCTSECSTRCLRCCGRSLVGRWRTSRASSLWALRRPRGPGSAKPPSRWRRPCTGCVAQRARRCCLPTCAPPSGICCGSVLRRWMRSSGARKAARSARIWTTSSARRRSGPWLPLRLRLPCPALCRKVRRRASWTAFSRRPAWSSRERASPTSAAGGSRCPSANFPTMLWKSSMRWMRTSWSTRPDP